MGIATVSYLAVIDSPAFYVPAFTKRAQPTVPNSDEMQIAAVPYVPQIEQLGEENSTKFQAVVADAIRRFKAAASQATDPLEAAYLSGLADRFQRLEDTARSANFVQPLASTPVLSILSTDNMR